MSDHKHGEMNIEAQENTFNGFITFVTRSIIVILAAVVFLALLNA